MKNKQPSKYPAGMYFGLSNRDYHADGALSSSGIKRLKNAPIDYWYSVKAFNQNAISKQTLAMEESDMFHMLLLEPERFHERYQVAGVEGIDPNKKIVPSRDYDSIMMAINLIRALPRTGQLFTGGHCEVSIFWPDKETGLMKRCRPDYLKPNVCVDYKALREVSDKEMKYAIVNYGYDAQAALYTEGVTTIKTMLKNGKAKVYGDHNEQWLNDFLESEDMHFVFAFQQKTPPFVIKTKEAGQSLLQLGDQKVAEAMNTYSECLAEYGTEPWPAGNDEIEVLETDDMPMGIYY